MKHLLKNQSFLTAFKIVMLFICFVSFRDTLLASSDPFSSIDKNVTDLAKSITSIVQAVAIISIVIYGGFTFFNGTLDKMRIAMMIIGIVLTALAGPLVDYLKSWN